VTPTALIELYAGPMREMLDKTLIISLLSLLFLVIPHIDHGYLPM